MDDSRIKSARELLGAFFDAEQLGRAGLYTEFFASWKFLVGEHLAAHSHVADVEGGKLIVEAEHPGWIQLLQLRQRSILDGIAERFPELELRSIVFRLGSARPDGRGARGGNPTVAPPPSEEQALEAHVGAESPEPENSAAPRVTLDTIESPELRDLLSQLRTTIAKGKSG